MLQLTILQDGTCGLCEQARRWLSNQPVYLALEFLQAGGTEAIERFPELAASDTTEELTVIADDGRVWLGDAAWITCLWATRRHRSTALRLAQPTLRPLARAFFTQLSTHRRGLSQYLASRRVAS